MFRPIGTPLDDIARAQLSEEQYSALMAFFAEASYLLNNPNAVKIGEDSRLVPPESLQKKYDAIKKFDGDRFCSVRQYAVVIALDNIRRPTY